MRMGKFTTSLYNIIIPVCGKNLVTLSRHRKLLKEPLILVLQNREQF